MSCCSQGDVRDVPLLDKLFSEEKFDAVIHFAGFKAVGESVEKPLEYYDNNFVASVRLLEVMRKHNCYNVCESSCFACGSNSSSSSSSGIMCLALLLAVAIASAGQIAKAAAAAYTFSKAFYFVYSTGWHTLSESSHKS
jgi:hypothetical protein